MTGTTFDVTGTVQRSQLLLTEFRTFSQDRVDHVRGGYLSVCRKVCIVAWHIQQFIHYELNITKGSFILWHGDDLVAVDCYCSIAADNYSGRTYHRRSIFRPV